MLLANLGGADLIIVIVIVLFVIVGGSQLPKIARNLGSAGREFKKGQEEGEAEKLRDQAAKEASAIREEGADRLVPPPAVTAGGSEDKVTMSKADLEALLTERERRTGTSRSTESDS